MPLAGQKVRASDIQPLYMIRKAAGESVTSSTTSQNDDDITISLDVGTWVIDLYAQVNGATAGDVRIKWTNTGTMTCVHRSAIAPGANTTDATQSASSRIQAGQVLGTEYGYGTDATVSSRVHERLVMEVTVAGTLQLQWAQLASSGTATTLGTQTHAVWQQVDEQ